MNRRAFFGAAVGAVWAARASMAMEAATTVEEKVVTEKYLVRVLRAGPAICLPDVIEYTSAEVGRPFRCAWGYVEPSERRVLEKLADPQVQR